MQLVSGGRHEAFQAFRILETRGAGQARALPQGPEDLLGHEILEPLLHGPGMGPLGDGHSGVVDLRPAQLARHIGQAGPGFEGVFAADELELPRPGPELEERGGPDHPVPLQLVGDLIDVGTLLHQYRGLLPEGPLALPGPPAARHRRHGQQEGGQEEPEGHGRTRHASRMP